MDNLKKISKIVLTIFGIIAVSALFTIIIFANNLFFDDVVIESEESKTGVFVESTKPAPETPLETISEPTIETPPEDNYTFYDVPFDIDTQKEIIKICSEYDITYELILGIISVESSFKPGVIGDSGNSFGLMQIQPKWWSEIMEREGVTNLLDPLQNIRCGCAILRELIDKYGTEYRALQTYNTGKPYTNNGYAEKVYRHTGELMIYGG